MHTVWKGSGFDKKISCNHLILVGSPTKTPVLFLFHMSDKHFAISNEVHFKTELLFKNVFFKTYFTFLKFFPLVSISSVKFCCLLSSWCIIASINMLTVSVPKSTCGTIMPTEHWDHSKWNFLRIWLLFSHSYLKMCNCSEIVQELTLLHFLELIVNRPIDSFRELHFFSYIFCVCVFRSHFWVDWWVICSVWLKHTADVSWPSSPTYLYGSTHFLRLSISLFLSNHGLRALRVDDWG